MRSKRPTPVTTPKPLGYTAHLRVILNTLDGNPLQFTRSYSSAEIEQMRDDSVLRQSVQDSVRLLRRVATEKAAALKPQGEPDPTT